MWDLIAKVDTLPTNVLGAPGKALLGELIECNAGWAVDLIELKGEWFLIEKDKNGFEQPVPIEMFELEESNELF